MKSVISKVQKTVHKHLTKESSMIEEIIQKVKTLVKNEEEIFSRENIIKYTVLAVVALYGLRSGGWLRSLVLSALTGVVAERLMENATEKEAAKDKTSLVN